MYRLVLGICLLLGILPGSAAAEPRLALVIGISDYRSLGLDNRTGVGDADARLMAKTLEQLGFNVQMVLEADQKGMKKAVGSFGQALIKAGPDATGLFYFSGFGVAASGEQFLMPVGAQVQDVRDLDLETVSLATVARQMDFSGCQTKIMILETDRNNPFPSGAGQAMGVTPPNSAGFFVAYAAGDGGARLEAPGANNLFTQVLTQEMLKTNVDIASMTRAARNLVYDATQSRQVPNDMSTLLAPYFFRVD
jgi:carboxyl-terminal processing protease